MLYESLVLFDWCHTVFRNRSSVFSTLLIVSSASVLIRVSHRIITLDSLNNIQTWPFNEVFYHIWVLIILGKDLEAWDDFVQLKKQLGYELNLHVVHVVWYFLIDLVYVLHVQDVLRCGGNFEQVLENLVFVIFSGCRGGIWSIFQFPDLASDQVDARVNIIQHLLGHLLGVSSTYPDLLILKLRLMLLNTTFKVKLFFVMLLVAFSLSGMVVLDSAKDIPVLH